MTDKEEIKDGNLYLPEDQKLLEELEASGALAVGTSSPNQAKHLQIAQIKATLRSRKSFDKADKSSTRFSKIFGVFALIQIVIALLQFTLEAGNAKYKWEGFLLTIALAIFLSIIINLTDKNLKEK